MTKASCSAAHSWYYIERDGNSEKPDAIVLWATAVYCHAFVEGLHRLSSSFEELHLYDMPCCGLSFLSVIAVESVLAKFALSMRQKLLHLKEMISSSMCLVPSDSVLFFPDEIDLAAGGCPRAVFASKGDSFRATCALGGSTINFLHTVLEDTSNAINKMGKSCRGFEEDLVSLKACRTAVECGVQRIVDSGVTPSQDSTTDL